MVIKISYLLPSFNHKNYLLQMLDSIKQDLMSLNQSAEVIIIDDGSTDNSVTIIDNWVKVNKECFSIQFLAQTNQGISATLNQLTTMANGEYLRLCASDDEIIPGSTARLFNKAIVNNQCLCVVGDGQVIDDKNNIIHNSSIGYHRGNIHRLKKTNNLLKELIQHWCIAGPSILIKKSHYQLLRYNETSTIDDFDLFLSLLKIPNSIIFTDEIVCRYRLHTTNTSKTTNVSRRIKNLKSFKSIIEKYVYEHPGACYLMPLKYKSLAKIYYLEKRYSRCFFNICLSLFYKIKKAC